MGADARRMPVRERKLTMIRPSQGQKFKHFKGGIYKVHFIAKSADTQDNIVCYESLTHGGYWARRLEEWQETVDRPEYQYIGPRFALIHETDAKNKI